MAEIKDPFEKFREWYNEAKRSSHALPNAMCLSTVGADRCPSARMVLLSSFDRRGFVFHTNYESRKGADLAAFPRAALLFWWELLNRQVRIEGSVERTSPDESDAYFAERARGSQLSAWASSQSRPLPPGETLEGRMRMYEEQFKDLPVPRPPHWGGYRLLPRAFEFWTGREDRLHERIRYDRTPDRWTVTLLDP
jgi:pyridoxamine 5'-phosphate oxidase